MRGLIKQDKTSRIILFLILLPLLGVIFYAWEGSIFPTSSTSIVLFSALLMLAFVTLFIEHFFTRPSDVLASSISILLLLSPMSNQLNEWGVWYQIFYAYNLLLLTTSFLALLLADKNKSPDCKQNKAAYYLKQFSVSFGNGRWLYFSLFILTLLFYVDSQSPYFLLLFGFAAVILLAHPKEFIERILTREAKHTTDIGEIFGVHSKNTFLAKLYEERAAVTRFDFVEFRYQMDRKTYRGLIIDTYFLNQAQWVKILTSSEINAALDGLPLNPEQADNVISKITTDQTPELLERLVGLTIERTDILKLRFEYIGKAKVSEGSLLEVKADGQTILYQVVQGITATELLESKDERGFIVGEAIQLGTWNKERCTFEKFGWVPAINSPVYLAAPIEAVTPAAGEYIIGYIPPDQHFPAIINKEEAVTHHLAILGVTGTGKSVFARNLIREIMADGTKVICVDFTYEYKKRFDDCTPVVPPEISKTMFKTIDDLTLELAKYKDKQDATKITNWQRSLHSGFAKAIKEFLKSDRKVAIFELPDVSNTVAALEYTRWFFNVLFKVAKHKKSYGNRVCIVLEEAHTVVPEYNFMGVSDNSSKHLVNSIGQIALQGRKYDIGFMVIAQRTANVSKTILTQCNSIIAFQQFDRTSSDFLSAYMGRDLAEALPRLKPRHAVAVGKAFKANIPMIFRVPDIEEPEIQQEE
jgi:hypothetical protein